MGFENLGPNVSQNPQAITPGGGQYTAEDHSWEQLVIQQNKPAADWELNLLQQIYGAYGIRQLAQRHFPSFWLNSDFLETSDGTGSYILLAPDVPGPPPATSTANTFQLAAADVNVNGWMIRFDLSSLGTLQSVVSGLNSVTLPSPPTGGQRTDLVILEVWRALVSPAPSSANKSQAGQILRFGNAKSPDTPINENLGDDLLDPVFASETARRVQIQYRWRVVEGIDIFSFPNGLDSPLVVANTVPSYPSPGADGSATAFTYIPTTRDAGLWRAGTGDSPGASSLGTVDGYMYAIPICAVFRRNSTAFNRSTNMNGAGLMATGISGRPDGLYADQISVGDILDLRKGIAYDFTEVLDKAFEELLANTLSTQGEINQTYGFSNFVSGTSYEFRDDIGVGGHIGNPDGVRTDFSDRSVVDSIVAVQPVSAPTTSVVFNANSLTPSYVGATALNLTINAPAGTDFYGVGRVRLVTSAGDTDLLNTSASVFATSIAVTATTLTITLNAAVGTTGFIYAEILVEYPGAAGCQRNVTAPLAVWTPPAASIASWVDGATLTATSDANRFSLAANLWWSVPGHRETTIHLKTVTQSPPAFHVAAEDTSHTTIYIPEMVAPGTSISINDGTNSYTTTAFSFNANYTKVTLSFSVTPPGSITARYVALRPPQPVTAAPNDSYQVWYTTRAIQSIAVPAGIQTLGLYARGIGKEIHVITSGSGSPDTAAPFLSPSTQIPAISTPPSPNIPESLLNTPNVVAVTGFSINAGYVSLPIYVPYTPDPGHVQLYSAGDVTTTDGDGRHFWPRSDNGLVPVYAPTAYAQNLLFSQRHKVAFPVLMELRQDTPFGSGSIGRKGTLVLVVFTQWYEYSNQNSINLSPSLSATCAAVYRVRGNLLNPRRTS